MGRGRPPAACMTPCRRWDGPPSTDKRSNIFSSQPFVFSLVQMLACLPASHMQVWEFAGPGFISWQSSDVGLPYMGCVVENRLLQAALLRAATAAGAGPANSSSSGSGGGCLDLLCPASVKGVWLPGSSGSSSAAAQPSLQDLTTAGSSGSSSGSSLAELELADGSRLRCRLLVAADGARSRVREMAGFRTVGWSYNQHGLVATVATAEPNDTAWQRFLPSGPLALLPVRDGYSNVVWTVSPQMAKQLESSSSREFADAVNAALQQDPASLASSAAAGGPAAAAGTAGAVLQGLTGALSSASIVGPLLGGAASSLGVLGGGAAAAEAGGQGGSSWRAPPLVQGWVGSSPKSFPLQMQHSGR
jgi:ubiquinone biosynthesis monooxygenase Coq6